MIETHEELVANDFDLIFSLLFDINSRAFK
jgi:hypothetical protein